MKYVSIDIETTGLDPKTCDIIEFAAILDDLGAPLHLAGLPSFHCYVTKDGPYSGEPFALSLHSKTFKTIADYQSANTAGSKVKAPEGNFYRPDEIMAAFQNWLSKNGVEPDKDGKYSVTVAGKNFASFDWPFLKEKIPAWYWYDVSFKHRVLDPSVLYFNPATDTELPSSKLCMERAGFIGDVAHTALEDALMVVKLIRKKLL